MTRADFSAASLDAFLRTDRIAGQPLCRAYNLPNFMRTMALPEEAEQWISTTGSPDPVSV